MAVGSAGRRKRRSKLEIFVGIDQCLGEFLLLLLVVVSFPQVLPAFGRNRGLPLERHSAPFYLITIAHPAAIYLDGIIELTWRREGYGSGWLEFLGNQVDG